MNPRPPLLRSLDPRLKEKIPARDVQERVAVLAEELNNRYTNEPLVAVGVLKGAALFYADLVRLLTADLTMDFVRVASYGDAMQSSGSVTLVQDCETSLEGKHVLLVEDVVDSGLSLRFLLDEFVKRSPLSLTVCALVEKTGNREVEVPVDHCGFRMRSGFLVGYGMDLAERYRNLGGIYEIMD
ncbi:MAG: hypoxanthine phosphoribosyltransferase [Desulfovibrio sp.]|nr:MAG: hypoxanthine phosphoribosyltransferase [Desulfovibrio sp.]